MCFMNTEIGKTLDYYKIVKLKRIYDSRLIVLLHLKTIKKDLYITITEEFFYVKVVLRLKIV